MPTFQEKVEAFRVRLETAQAERYRREYPSLVPPTAKAIYRVKYVLVDVAQGSSASGKYMIPIPNCDVADAGTIYGIKGYGVIHRGHRYGTLDTIDEYDWSGYAAVRRHPVLVRGEE